LSDRCAALLGVQAGRTVKYLNRAELKAFIHNVHLQPDGVLQKV
jgi:hypothetical protein